MNRILHTHLLLRSRFSSRPERNNRLSRILIVISVALASILSTGFTHAEQSDPLEGWNRPVHEFNSVVDSWIFRPLAITYRKVTPRFMQRGIKNVVSNLDDVSVTVNDILQGKFSQAGMDFSRLAINSTLGIGGLLDVADTVFELEKHDEDLGQTLAHWGVDRGPYIVLPLLGPSTVREGIGGVTNLIFNPGFNTNKSSIRDKYIILSGLSARVDLLGFEGLIVGDEYLFLREVYLQNLNYREADTNPLVTFEEF